MPRTRFRFHPPRIEPPPEVVALLARAFGAAAAGGAPDAPDADACATARVLGVAARVGVGELARDRALAAAQGLRLESARHAVAAAARAARIPWAALKGQALEIGGWVAPGARPSGDCDLLLPAEALAPLAERLRASGFDDSGEKGYEHQAPALVAPDGGRVELHRSIPGLRIVAGRSATFADLAAHGLLAPLVGEDVGGFLPARRLLAAHALVHGVAQHGFAPGLYPPLRWAGDLVDLGAAAPAGTPDRDDLLAAALEWTHGEVSEREARAAFALAEGLAALPGRPLAELPPDARRLLDHALAAAFEPRYSQALKARAFERPISDRPRWQAKLAAIGGALAPVAGESHAERALEVWRRWRVARRARRALEP